MFCNLHVYLHSLDHDGDGYITVEEVQIHLEAVKEGTIVLSALTNPEMKKKMEQFDVDNDGKLRLDEIVSAFTQSQLQVRMANRALVVLLVALLISYIVIGGLVFYVIQVAKESRVETHGLMMVKDSNQTVQVGSADFTVVNGVLHTKVQTCSKDTCQSSQVGVPIQSSQVCYI